LLVLALLPKNPRLAMPLDFVVRFGAVSALTAIANRVGMPRLRAMLAGGLAICTLDVVAFRHYFVTDGLYDPVAANLFQAAHFLPATPPAAAPEPTPAADAKTRIDSLRRDVARNPSPEMYLTLSLAFYQDRDFEASRDASQAALRLKPDYGDAYNNLGLAEAELGNWDASIAALEAAVRLSPGQALAGNNLAWIRQRAAAARGK